MIVSILLFSMVLIAAYIASHRLTGSQLVVVFATASLGIALIVFPNLASFAASAIGVGRGTDLLLYFAIVCGFFVVANFFFRFKRQERQLAIVVRELAILGEQRKGRET